MTKYTAESAGTTLEVEAADWQSASEAVVHEWPEGASMGALVKIRENGKKPARYFNSVALIERLGLLSTGRPMTKLPSAEEVARDLASTICTPAHVRGTPAGDQGGMACDVCIAAAIREDRRRLIDLYGRHMEGCLIYAVGNEPCNCGFTALLSDPTPQPAPAVEQMIREKREQILAGGYKESAYRCSVRSSVTDSQCVLAAGHAADSDRFHKFAEQPAPEPEALIEDEDDRNDFGGDLN